MKSWVLAIMVLVVATIAQAAQFALGDRVRCNTLYPAVLVRDAPAGTRLGSQPQGALGTVVGGPQTASGFTWWQINYDTGLDGWSTGDALDLVAVTTLPGKVTALTVTVTTVVQLAWNANTEPDLAGYRIYARFPGGPDAQVGSTTSPSGTAAGLEKGKTYLFAVTAYDRSGNESAKSAEASYTVP